MEPKTEEGPEEKLTTRLLWLEAIEKAARAWYEVQRGTMATMGPTGLKLRDALKEY